MTIHNISPLNIPNHPRTNCPSHRPFKNKKIYTLEDLPANLKSTYNDPENKKSTELCQKVDFILESINLIKETKVKPSLSFNSFKSNEPSRKNVDLIIQKSQEAIQRSESAIQKSFELTENSLFVFIKRIILKKFYLPLES